MEKPYQSVQEPFRSHDMYRRFFGLEKRSEEAFNSSDYEKAKLLAQENLKIADSFKRNWNYGNVIHKCNLMLGRIALKQENVEEAKEYLLRAGKTPGSPQLKSFGPNMLLAKELLELGEKEVVLEYFDLCSKFWGFIGRFFSLRKWKKIVKNGDIPDFESNLLY